MTELKTITLSDKLADYTSNRISAAAGAETKLITGSLSKGELTYTSKNKDDETYRFISDTRKASMIRYTYSEDDEGAIYTMGGVHIEPMGNFVLFIYRLKDNGKLVKQLVAQPLEVISVNSYDIGSL